MCQTQVKKNVIDTEKSYYTVSLFLHSHLTFHAHACLDITKIIISYNK